jgi:hypothetical protein
MKNIVIVIVVQSDGAAPASGQTLMANDGNDSACQGAIEWLLLLLLLSCCRCWLW